MIISSHNERVKQLRKLHDKKHRDASGRFAAEGEDLVRAALDAGQAPIELFCAPGAPADLTGHGSAQEIEQAVLDGASALGSGSRVIGVFERRLSPLEGGYALAVYLDAIADPGNVGTVLRAALAFSDGPVILGPGCADPFSPKAVRASMGAIFARPPATATPLELAALPARRVALAAEAETPLVAVAGAGYDVRPTIVCVGAERTGLSADVVASADVTAAIPMLPGGPESLNAAIAASIALYEIGSALRVGLQTPVHAGDETAAANGKSGGDEK